jgi:ABC-type nitrate/sulfonate/bicarbonate transport system substrate-binding protein
MRRDQRVLGFVVALVLIWDISAASAQQLEKVVIGHSSLRNDIAFLWVPQQLGFFKKNGLDPTIVFISGGVRMIQAIVSESAPMVRPELSWSPRPLPAARTQL